MERRSIGSPLVLGIALSLVTAALAVGWQVLLAGGLRPVTEGLTPLHWVFIILGSALFVLLIVGLVWLCAWLVREMRLNQRQQAFLDAVTHEMKTPLASLRLYLETLERHDLTPERRDAFLVRMSEDVTRLEGTVTQVLAAARSEARVRRSGGELFDLTEMLQSCVDEMTARHELPGDALALELPAQARVWGNREELRVVFRNLIENAVEYSKPPVRVRVLGGPRPDGRFQVDIVDQGIGIERRELRKIFQRFYRAGRGVQQAAGLGLGLFIVRNLVRRQGGQVSASSEGSGLGSRFVVTLRTTPRGEPAGARRALAVEPGRAGGAT